MKCKVCNAHWCIGNNAVSIHECPVCAEDFKLNKENRIPDSVKEFLLLLIEDEGIEICKDSRRINGFLSDIFPSDELNRTVVQQALEIGIGDWLHSVLLGEQPKDDAKSVLLDMLADKVDDESKAKIVDAVYFIGKFNVIAGDDTKSKEFYVRQIENLSEDNYKVLALEKALAFGDDATLNLELAKLKEKLGHHEEAKALTQKSADLGNADSLYTVAIELLNSDYAQAIESLKKAADIGHAQSCFKLYQFFYKSSESRKEALENLKKAAFANYVPAMYEYGLHLLYGDDVQEDVESGLKFLEESALKGDYDAKSKLRYIYSVGFKVNKDIEKARTYNCIGE